MENNEPKKEPKVADSEDYNVNKPQNLNIPEYNSATGHRSSDKIPGVENLNEEDGLNGELKDAKSDNGRSSSPKNDESLHGEPSKTDLGNGQRTPDEKKNENIIKP